MHHLKIYKNVILYTFLNIVLPPFLLIELICGGFGPKTALFKHDLLWNY